MKYKSTESIEYIASQSAQFILRVLGNTLKNLTKPSFIAQSSELIFNIHALSIPSSIQHFCEPQLWRCVGFLCTSLTYIKADFYSEIPPAVSSVPDAIYIALLCLWYRCQKAEGYQPIRRPLLSFPKTQGSSRNHAFCELILAQAYFPDSVEARNQI